MPTFYEDSMRRRMLPQTLGLTSPDGVLTQDVKPPALPLSMAIRKQIADLEAQNDDTSAAQAYGRQQGESGQAAMLNALAAQFAGPQFENVQAQFLKRAQAAQQPMRVGKGMVTPDGQFIGDPGAKREAQITRLSREAEFADRSESQAALQAERLAAQKAAQEAELQRRRERDQDQSAYRRDSLALRAGQGGGMPKAPSGYQWSTGPDGSLTQTFIPGGPADPANKAAKDPTEDQGKSAGYAFRMDSALRQIAELTKQDPTAAKPSLVPTLVGKLPGVGEMAQKAITPAQRQRVENAQLDALDAALTLSTGAAYTREQLKMISNAYFPQIGETDQRVIDDKSKRLADLVEVARTRAGRAAVPGMSANPAAPPTQAASGLSAAEQAELMKLRQKFGR